MTSDVKSALPILFHGLHLLDSGLRRPSEELGPVKTTVDPAEIRGLTTTLLASVGCLPRSRHEGWFQPPNAVEGCTKPGLRLFRCTVITSCNGCWAFNGLGLWGQRDLLGNSPHKSTQFPGDGDNHLVGVFPAGDQLPIA